MPMYRLVLIMFIGGLLSCSEDNRPAGTVITGTVNHSGPGPIYLELLTAEGFELMDSSQTANDGSFHLQTHSQDDHIYRINFYNQQKITLVLGGPTVDITADGKSADGLFNLQGNSGGEDYSTLIELRNSHQLQQGLLNHKINSARQLEDEAEFNGLIQQQQQSTSIYVAKATYLVKKQEGSLTGLFMLSEFFDIEPNLAMYNKLMPTFENTLADHWYFEQVFDKYTKTRRLAKGAIAPDFKLPDPEGNEIQLSSLKGKYVYLDFWASWCQPCRRDNPHLVKVYEKYEGLNFEIFGVSFDKRKDKWLDAIEKDQLDWVHASDLEYFDSKMIELYNITNVPTTLFLDPEGRIIAKNLHYSELDQMLDELL